MKKTLTGQAGPKIMLRLSELNPNEKAVVDCLQGSSDPVSIKEISVRSGWDQINAKKGNSRVRNALRRLVRSGLVCHLDEIGDATYKLPESGESAAPVVPTRSPRPVKLTLVGDPTRVASVKRGDCSLYNACLDQAVSSKWPGFSCTECKGYEERGTHQQVMDVVRLNALSMVADELKKTGSTGRKRGVKEGTFRLPPEQTAEAHA